MSRSASDFKQETIVHRDLDRFRRLSFHIHHTGIIFGKSRPVEVFIEVCLEKRAGPGLKHQFVRVLDTATFPAGQLTFPVFNHFANQKLHLFAKVDE